MGADDTAFSASTRFRVVYDFRGDRRFRLIREFSPSSAAPAASPGKPPLPPPCAFTTSGGTVGYFAVWTASCSIGDSATPVFENGSGVGIGTTSPSYTLDVSGTGHFSGAVTFGSTVNGAVGNASGVVYHMDGVKYTSLDQLIISLPTGGAYTIYDDCPGGAETVSHDPFHPSDSDSSRRLLIISAPCLYTFNVPPIENNGDQWIGAPGGYNLVQQQNPTVAGTVFKMGPDMNGQVTMLPGAPSASYVNNAMDSNCPASTSLAHTHYYWIALTATNAVGETPLSQGNRNSLSWTLPGGGTPPGSNYCIKYGTGSFATNQTGVGVYMLDGGTMSGFPSNDSSFQVYQTAASANFYISQFQTGAGHVNPPPDSNTTQFLAGIGSCLNGPGNLITRAYYRGITFDASGGAIAVANCNAQDPPSGIEDDTFLDCAGDSCYLAEGNDGHLGANGSSARNLFVVPSACELSVGGGAIGGGCAGGLDYGPTGPGSITISGGTAVTGSGTNFATDFSLTNAIISINGSVSNCSTAPCEIASVSSATSLTLASSYTGTCSPSCSYALADVNNYATWPQYAVHLDRVAQFKSLMNLDFGGDNCGNSSTSTACNTQSVVKADGAAYSTYASKAEILDIHAEAAAANFETINAAVEINGMPAFVCGVHSSDHVTYSVQIDSGSTADTLCDIVPYKTSSFGVNDPQNVYSSSEGKAVGFYAVGTSTGYFLGSDAPISPALLPGATSSALGAIKLAGDLGNTSSAPEVFSTHLSSPLPVSQGGTGAVSLGTSGNVLLGNGTSAVTASANSIPSSAPSLDNSMLLFSSSGAGSMVRGPQVFNGAGVGTATGSTPVTIGTFTNSVDASASYYLFCDLQAHAQNTSNGLKVGINGTAGTATATTALIALQGVNATISATGSGFNTFIGANGSTTATIPYHFSASLVINAGGTIALQYESSGTGNVTIDSYACVLQ